MQERYPNLKIPPVAYDNNQLIPTAYEAMKDVFSSALPNNQLNKWTETDALRKYALAKQTLRHETAEYYLYAVNANVVQAKSYQKVFRRAPQHLMTEKGPQRQNDFGLTPQVLEWLEPIWNSDRELLQRLEETTLKHFPHTHHLDLWLLQMCALCEMEGSILTGTRDLFGNAHNASFCPSCEKFVEKNRQRFKLQADPAAAKAHRDHKNARRRELISAQRKGVEMQQKQRREVAGIDFSDLQNMLQKKYENMTAAASSSKVNDDHEHSGDGESNPAEKEAMSGVDNKAAADDLMMMENEKNLDEILVWFDQNGLSMPKMEDVEALVNELPSPFPNLCFAPGDEAKYLTYDYDEAKDLRYLRPELQEDFNGPTLIYVPVVRVSRRLRSADDKTMKERVESLFEITGALNEPIYMDMLNVLMKQRGYREYAKGNKNPFGHTFTSAYRRSPSHWYQRGMVDIHDPEGKTPLYQRESVNEMVDVTVKGNLIRATLQIPIVSYAEASVAIRKYSHLYEGSVVYLGTNFAANFSSNIVYMALIIDLFSIFGREKLYFIFTRAHGVLDPEAAAQFSAQEFVDSILRPCPAGQFQVQPDLRLLSFLQHLKNSRDAINQIRTSHGIESGSVILSKLSEDEKRACLDYAKNYYANYTETS